jgi:HEPN domain-containing protein
MERGILKERAMRFLKEAEDDIAKGFFDLSAFHSEQAIKLGLKSFLLEKIGYFSRTHSLIALVEEVSKVSPGLVPSSSSRKKSLKNSSLHTLAAGICRFRTQGRRLWSFWGS